VYGIFDEMNSWLKLDAAMKRFKFWNGLIGFFVGDESAKAWQMDLITKVKVKVKVSFATSLVNRSCNGII